ncbi:hypothetical protein Nepgr_006065 [Nepenthes gracilis]|uniref:Uncharacterized protein n=1 Tax=Nepenthes gracilis TaxID=150966 RepID=A0AAD3S4J1_NEPGR|nr:hypothetical protein Nepgr_006065 [Nepenthes gracilis]
MEEVKVTVAFGRERPKTAVGFLGEQCPAILSLHSLRRSSKILELVKIVDLSCFDGRGVRDQKDTHRRKGG